MLKLPGLLEISFKPNKLSKIKFTLTCKCTVIYVCRQCYHILIEGFPAKKGCGSILAFYLKAEFQRI